MSDIEEKSDDECEESIRQFAEIVECDEAYAHSILQDFDYDLDVNEYKFYHLHY